MLVTCFGYTGYRNAKFGQIQVHERITETSRELLMQIKEMAEEMGFEVLAEAKRLEDLREMEPKAQQVYRRYVNELDGVDVKDLAIHRRVSRLNYSRRCAEASAVQAHMKQGIPLAQGMEIGYVIRDARKWEVDPVRTASKFDAIYYRGLLEKAWGEAAFVFL